MGLHKCSECGGQVSNKTDSGINFKAADNATKGYQMISCAYCQKKYIKINGDNDGICPYCGIQNIHEGKNKNPDIIKAQEEIAEIVVDSKSNAYQNTDLINDKKKKELKRDTLWVAFATISLLVLCTMVIIYRNRTVEKEKQLYKTVLQVQQDIVDIYGVDIEPLQVIYLYRDLEKFPPDEEFSYDYDTGYYVYCSYNLNPEGEEDRRNFIWHGGEFLFENPIKQDMFAEINAQLRKMYIVEFLLLMGEAPSTTIEEVNNQINGSCEIDINILEKYIGMTMDE